jgi:hypothetical protein
VGKSGGGAAGAAKKNKNIRMLAALQNSKLKTENISKH